MINLFKYINESLFDVDDNIDAVEKIKDDPKAMLSRNCKNFEEVVEVFSKWFGCKPPKIKKSSKLLKTTKNSGIRLSNDKIAEFNLITKDHRKGKVIILALWGNKLLFYKRDWYLKNRWGGPPVKKYDDFIDVIGQWDRESYKWGTNLWDWLDLYIKRGNLSSYAVNKSDYICESIFDDEEEQMNKIDGAVMIDQIKKEDSMFRQEYQCYEKHPRFGSLMMQNASWERGVLKIPAKFINHSSVKGEVHPLSFYIPNTKELICCNFRDGARGELSPKTLCDKITCAYFFKDITNNVKDMHIVIDPAYIRKELKVSSNNRPDVVFSGFYSPIIENTKIEFIDPIPGGNLGKHIAFHEFPTFKNVESNANYISVYDPSAFDHDDLDKIFDVFEWPLKATIKDFKKSADIEMTINGLKKAKAIANNPKRYFPITQVFKLKPNAKLSDIIDISKMKNLQRFAYKDNSISLIFDKDPIKSMCNCEPEPLKIETHQKTKDGYYVYLECEK